MHIFLGIIFLVVLPYSALADMMERTTSGDMMFFFVEILLALAIVVSFVLWIITLPIRRITKVSRFLGYTTLALGGALCLAILMGEIYYHYLGYGAYKKASAKMNHTRVLLRLIDQSCESYYMEHGQFPTNEEEVIRVFKEYTDPGFNESIRQRVILDSWGTPIECTLKGNKVAARSAGPDRKFNTKDDLKNANY
jgi:hypothetical protein